MFVDKEEWNEFVKQVAARYKTPHILQTAAWGELKSAFGWDAVRIVAGENGALVLLRVLVPRLGSLSPTIAYIPKGPIGEDWAALLPDLDALCRKRRVVLLKIEPDLWEHEIKALPSALQLKSSAHAIQPPRTIVIDISGSEESILAQMKQKTRYNIRVAEKNGVEVHPSPDITVFQDLMEVTGERDGFGVHSLAIITPYIIP
jgi:lipid II:glycine glycyltransferase (peptidoglycan interpeptide bridge formation enzyme)